MLCLRLSLDLWKHFASSFFFLLQTDAPALEGFGHTRLLLSASGSCYALLIKLLSISHTISWNAVITLSAHTVTTKTYAEGTNQKQAEAYNVIPTNFIVWCSIFLSVCTVDKENIFPSSLVYLTFPSLASSKEVSACVSCFLTAAQSKGDVVYKVLKKRIRFPSS